ncbi:MAG TPA: flagellar hook-associated protein FlgL [Urbifossiella sp.]|nr:flagellar hook-associated protein FlgL [Urbifossiella sp.]
MTRRARPAAPRTRETAVNLRVTAQTQSDTVIRYMQQQTTQLAMYQNQVSSGQKIVAPSDDPANYPAFVQAQAASQRYDMYGQTISSATTDLNASAAALGTVNDALTQAKTLAQEGINSTTDASGYSALATEVDGLVNQVLGVANTQVNGKYVFGGTATDTQPFQMGTNASGTSTVTYQGSNAPAQVLIGQGQTVDTKYAGNQVFQQSGGDVFQALIGLRDTLRDTTLSGPAKAQALTQQLSNVDAARDAIGDTTAVQSSHLATLSVLQTQTSGQKLSADERVGDIGGTDYTQAIVKMNEQQTALQASMAVASKLLTPSLLSFIQ